MKDITSEITNAIKAFRDGTSPNPFDIKTVPDGEEDAAMGKLWDTLTENGPALDILDPEFPKEVCEDLSRRNTIII
jgi:hypothetical protein